MFILQKMLRCLLPPSLQLLCNKSCKCSPRCTGVIILVSVLRNTVDIHVIFIMVSWIGSNFGITDFTVMRSFDVFFDVSPNKLLKKNRVTGDLRRHDANVSVMILIQGYWYVWYGIFSLLTDYYIQRIIMNTPCNLRWRFLNLSVAA